MALENFVGYSMKSFIEEDDEVPVDEMMLTKVRNCSLPHESIYKGLKITDGATGKHIDVPIKKGTTTLSFKYQNGIVVAVDSRSSGGQYIFSKTFTKVIPIDRYLLATIAGGAADCQYWIRHMSVRCRMYELRNKERISVAAASKLFANILYNNKNAGLSIGTMIVGYDKSGPKIYWVDNEGTRTDGDSFCIGSGSPIALGVLDSQFKYDLTDKEAYDLGRRAILAATMRDPASGGSIRVYHVKFDGWTRISVQDCDEIYQKNQEEKMDL